MNDILKLADEALDLAGKATPGPWRWGDPKCRENPMSLYSEARNAGPIGDGFPLLWLRPDSFAVTAADDTRLIAFARTALPQLAEAVKALVADVEKQKTATRSAWAAQHDALDKLHVAKAQLENVRGERDVLRDVLRKVPILRLSDDSLTWTCVGCGARAGVDNGVLACPACGSTAIREDIEP